MFEIGWTEILLVGLVAVFVLKPKDYPEMMRAIGSFIAKARQMAGEFQGQFNEAMKDPGLQDVKKTIEEIRDLRNLHPIQQVKDTFVQMADEATKVRKEVEGVVTGEGVQGALPPPAAAVDPLPLPSFEPPPPAVPPQPLAAPVDLLPGTSSLPLPTPAAAPAPAASDPGAPSPPKAA